MKPGQVTQACFCSQTNRAEDRAIHVRTRVNLPAVSGQPHYGLANVGWLFSAHQMQERRANQTSFCRSAVGFLPETTDCPATVWRATSVQEGNQVPALASPGGEALAPVDPCNPTVPLRQPLW